MAIPGIMIDQAFRNFLNLWHLGLSPSLTLTTDHNGAVLATSSVTCMPAMNDLPHQQQDYHTPVRRHRSGKSSRLRRRKLRSNEVAVMERTAEKGETPEVYCAGDNSQDFSLEQNELAFPLQLLEFGDGISEVLNELASSHSCDRDPQPSLKLPQYKRIDDKELSLQDQNVSSDQAIDDMTNQEFLEEIKRILNFQIQPSPQSSQHW